MKKNILQFFILILFIMCFTVILHSQSINVIPTKVINNQVFAVKDSFVNMYLIKKNDKYIAVDAGNNIKNIERELKKLKIDIDKVAAVFLTHADSDHVAAVNLFKNAEVYISRDEEQMMKGILILF